MSVINCIFILFYAGVVYEYEKFIFDPSQTCAEEYTIQPNQPNLGEDRCKERCSSRNQCKYYFYTFLDAGSDECFAEWCALYEDCIERRKPVCNGTTYKKIGSLF